MRPLRVLTLNIWNRQGPWENRLRLLQKGISELDPDIVGLQEVIHRPGAPEACQASQIADAWSRSGGPNEIHVGFGPAWTYDNGDQFGNAILSRFPLRDGRTFDLPTRDSRSVVFARAQTPAGPVPFFVTHLSWKFDEGNLREEQALAIAGHVREMASKEDLPAILVGDLNAAPDATEIRFLRGLHALDRKSISFTDCFERAGRGVGFTFDPPNNPHAALTYEQPRRIDYVLVEGPDGRGRGMPLSCKVVLTDVVGADDDRYAASDHFGVFAEIRMD